ncbi:protein ripply1 isoform X1 [Meriones unguiculatus]|uniref:protein ripply1 isoform X1 n=1 Tax=Meriones unguiculatus TaxID=10047 RepID=UPI00293E18CB|nr:protein ripply1 isoform X1 [Meriones unguiculatus]
MLQVTYLLFLVSGSLEEKQWAQNLSGPFLQLGTWLFWPKSRSLDYMYSAGEMLLQNFPVQATINLYEDSDSEEDEKDKEDDEDEEVNERGPEKCVRVPEAEPHQATANYPNPPLTCPN